VWQWQEVHDMWTMVVVVVLVVANSSKGANCEHLCTDYLCRHVVTHSLTQSLSQKKEKSVFA
jgi:hypothetical protein